MKQITFDIIRSTQTVARELIGTEKVMPYVVFAYRQWGGYGKHGRQWYSDQGNFTATFAVSLSKSEGVLQKLSMWVGLEIIRCLRSFLGNDLGLALKWPNDILMQGKKIGGVLIERLEEVWLIGVGVNLLHVPETVDAPYSVGSVRELSGRFIGPEVFLERLMRAFEKLDDHLEVLTLEQLRDLYRDNLQGLGRQVRVVTRRKVFDGVLKDIQLDGAAIVDVGDCEEKVYAADIFI